MANCSVAWLAFAVYATSRGSNRFATYYEVNLANLDTRGKSTILKSYGTLKQCHGFSCETDGKIFRVSKSK